MTTTVSRRDSTRVFALVVGLLAGALVIAVAAPKRQPTEIRSGTTGDLTAGAGFAPSATGSAGAAGLGAGAEAGSASDAGGLAGETGAGTAGPGAGAAAGGGDSSGSAALPAPDGGAPGPDSQARGVTEDAIKIGITYPDLSALRALGPDFDNGDVEEQWRALEDRWRREGASPVHGRTINLVFRKYQVLSPEEQRAACIGLVRDEHVFAVVAQTYFAVGSECVAREMRTPLITSDGPSDAVFARSHPFLFSLGMSDDRVLRNLVHWADAKGLLDGKKVGIYYEDLADIRERMNKFVKAELARLGHELAAEHTTTQALGGPQDAVAVQRFRSAGVDVALLFTSKAGFMQQAQVQAYRPSYLESDFLFGTSDTATSTYPPEQFDGSLGFTGRRVGETPAGVPLGAEGDACIANYERFSGKEMEAETTQWAYVLTGCDLAKALLAGLQGAGRDVTHERLVGGLETMRTVPMTRYSPVTFTREKHHGADTQRTLRWDAGCTCWKAIGPFEPLFVP